MAESDGIIYKKPKSLPDRSSILVEFVECLQKINVRSDKAKLNEATITDNNGGLIYL